MDDSSTSVENGTMDSINNTEIQNKELHHQQELHVQCSSAGLVLSDAQSQHILSVPTSDVNSGIVLEVKIVTEIEHQTAEDFKTNNRESLMHLLKGNIGTGILAMPMAFLNSGLWTGFACLFVVGIVTIHCMHMLVHCNRIVCKRTGKSGLSYAGVMEMSLESGPLRLRKFARFGRHVVDGLLVYIQFGSCCVYIVFVATSFKQVIDTVAKYELDVRVYEVIVMCLLFPYVLIRNLRALAPFSTFANVLTLIGLVIIFQYIVRGNKNPNTLPAFSSFDKLPLIFGTAIFAFEGINLVMPLQNSMKNPKDFGGWTGVLNLGMVIVACLYIAVGFFGYLHFGADIKPSITLNMPVDQWIYLAVKVMFGISIFITYGVQFYVPTHILWPVIQPHLKVYFLKDYGEFVFRLICVFVTGGLAILVPHLDLLISLFGAMAGSSLALILPVIIDLVTLAAEDKPLNPVIALKDSLIICFGVVGCVTGTYTSMKQIVQTF